MRTSLNLKKPIFGGETGIRTPDRLLTYTRFPGVRLQPLIHLSCFRSSKQNGSPFDEAAKYNKNLGAIAGIRLATISDTSPLLRWSPIPHKSAVPSHVDHRNSKALLRLF